MTENINDWTIAALKEYFDQHYEMTETAIIKAEEAMEQRFQSVQVAVTKAEEKLEQRFQAMQMAVTKAETSTEKRFESVNEFRQQLADQSRTFMPRQEYENIHKNLNEKVDGVVKKMDKIENLKQGGSVVWAYILAAVSFIAAIISAGISITKLSQFRFWKKMKKYKKPPSNNLF
jgi:hypothetical protein